MAVTDLDAGLFRTLCDELSDALLVYDGSGAIVYANDACAGLLGYARDDLVGLNVEELVPLRHSQLLRRVDLFALTSDSRALQRGRGVQARHASGREVPVDVRNTPVTWNGQNLSVCSLRERPAGLEHLRLQTTALRSAANGIIITDTSGIIVWVNPAACAISGYEEKELLGAHTRMLKSGRHDAEFYDVLWRRIRHGEPWSGIIVNRRKDGTEYHEEQTIAPVLDDAGKVTHYIAIKQDVSEQHAVQAALEQAHEALALRVAEVQALNFQLQEMALRDPLTRLHNRRFLDESWRRVRAHALRTGEPVSMALFDLDKFKNVNDTHGHAVGDQVLVLLAELLRQQTRGTDLVCRMGGEEFLVVMPGALHELALKRADEWRARLESMALPLSGGRFLKVTTSIGVATTDALESLEETIARADAALYRAKSSGRNRVVSAAMRGGENDEAAKALTTAR